MPINKNELTMERVRKALSGFSVCLLLFLLCGSSALAAEIFRETVPLERNRVPLHLERYVEKDGKRKQPLLLVHGVTYSSHEFDVDYKDYSLARYFAGHGFEVWLLDIAGFGNSGSVGDGFRPDSDYAAEDIAAAVRCIMRRSRVSFVDVLGWSWGTVTSGRFAARHPEMVRRWLNPSIRIHGCTRRRISRPLRTAALISALWKGLWRTRFFPTPGAMTKRPALTAAGGIYW